MKRIVFLTLVIFLLIIIVNLSLSLLTLWSKKDLLVSAKNQLAKEQREHASLQQELNRVSNPSFVEQEARDKLFLGKPGDVIVLFPTASPSAMIQQIGDNRPIWQQWWELFFN